jgi:hypothetical protein
LNTLLSQRSMGLKHMRGLGVVVVAAGFLAGCAALTPRSPEEAVKERAEARWDALVKGDLKSAYDYYSPGTRQVLSLQSYEGSIRRGFWKTAHVEKVQCESNERCVVTVSIEYEFQGRRTPSGLQEAWIKEGGNWWAVR